jgi:hypothetical protein
MGFTLDGRFVLPAGRAISVTDAQVITITNADTRLYITASAGSAPQIRGFDGGQLDGRSLFLYNALTSTVIKIGNSPASNADFAISGYFDLNPRTGLWLRYFNEGPPLSGYRLWSVLSGG